MKDLIIYMVGKRVYKTLRNARKYSNFPGITITVINISKKQIYTIH